MVLLTTAADQGIPNRRGGCGLIWYSKRERLTAAPRCSLWLSGMHRAAPEIFSHPCDRAYSIRAFRCDTMPAPSASVLRVAQRSAAGCNTSAVHPCAVSLPFSEGVPAGEYARAGLRLFNPLCTPQKIKRISPANSPALHWRAHRQTHKGSVYPL